MAPCFKTPILVALTIVCLGFLVISQTHAQQTNAIPDSFQKACPVPTKFENADLWPRILRGFNLPSWDAEEDYRRPADEAFAVLQAARLTHIRLPVDPANVLAQHDYPSKVAAAVGNYVDKGFVVSIDMHHGRNLAQLYDENPKAAYESLSKSWSTLLPYLEGFGSEQILLELLNEPPTSQDVWWPQAKALVNELRAKRPDTTIVVAPAGASRHEQLIASEPFTDRNVIYAIHYYDPFPFTHQGAEWLNADDPVRFTKNMPFPFHIESPEALELLAELQQEGHLEAAEALRGWLSEPWDIVGIADALAKVGNWSRRYGAPVIINEFGVLDHHAPHESRLRWINAVVTLAMLDCLAWTTWDYADGFGFIDHETRLPKSDILRILSQPR